MIYLYSWYSYIFLLPAIIFAFYASFKVKTTFKKYEKISSKSNWTASDMSKMMLEKNGCLGVQVQRTSGNLTDNYNSNTHILNLSESVYNSNSIASLGVAAHEVGHAVQDNEEYPMLKLRNILVPITNIGSMAAIPLLIIGVLIELLAGSNALGSFGTVLVLIGIIAYGLATVFALVTLPVEFNASRRAGKMLLETGVLDRTEVRQAKKVLSAAALTYIAAFTVSLMYFLRLLWILSKIRRR
jgi:hypothetical protein